MIKLGTVLNQLLDDIVQAKHYANGISKVLLTEYQKDPVLKHIPAPGLTLKELSFALKFAFVAKDVQKVSESLAKSFFLDNIRPSIADAFINSLTDRAFLEPLKKSLKDAFESINNTDDFNLTEAMSGNHEKSIQSFLKVSQDIYNVIPIDVRKKLSTPNDILKIIEEKTRQDMPLHLSKLRLQLPNPITNGLDLTLDKDDLQSLSAPAIQELKIVLGSEDLQFIDSTTKSNQEVNNHG
jgi:hypothetical protein